MKYIESRSFFFYFLGLLKMSNITKFNIVNHFNKIMNVTKQPLTSLELKNFLLDNEDDVVDAIDPEYKIIKGDYKLEDYIWIHDMPHPGWMDEGKEMDKNYLYVRYLDDDGIERIKDILSDFAEGEIAYWQSLGNDEFYFHHHAPINKNYNIQTIVEKE